MAQPADIRGFSLGSINACLRWALGLTLLMLILQLLPEGVRDALRYDRSAIAGGQLWRIVTGHFVHLGWGHFLLNAWAFLVIAWLFGPDLRLRDCAVALAVSALACGGGLYLLSPAVSWCVGLSGVLHGLVVFGALGWVMHGNRLGGLLLLGVLGKLTWEHFLGAVPLSAGIVGGSVVTDAHLWGAIGGLLAGAGVEFSQRVKQ